MFPPPPYAYESPVAPAIHLTASPGRNLFSCVTERATDEEAETIVSSDSSPPENGITVALLDPVAMKTALCTVDDAREGVSDSFPATSLR